MTVVYESQFVSLNVVDLITCFGSETMAGWLERGLITCFGSETMDGWLERGLIG
jgi:hypothetical protein